MSNGQTPGSVGVVKTQYVKISLPEGGLRLECGKVLPEINVAYETYGQLTDKKDNAVFICHALSGDAHVAGIHDDAARTVGWWDEMVGPGKGIDTNNYFVICANILGGCKGTTGPSSTNPATGRPYGSSFPRITVGDIVDVQRLLTRRLGLEKLAAVVGGSFGGMQVLEWAIRYPDMVGRCICIASSLNLSAQALAFDIVGRRAITSDPEWNGGDYYGRGKGPSRGLAEARMIGHITYLSPEMMTTKFGREKKAGKPGQAGSAAAAQFHSDFQVESYLDYQGEKFVERFDANSYLQITNAMDEYDVAQRYGSLQKAFERVKAKLLVVSLSEDWLFPPEQSAELANALIEAGKAVTCCKLHAPHGHDAFLVDIENLADVIRAFLPWVGDYRMAKTIEAKLERQDAAAGSGVPDHIRQENEIIARMIKKGTRVLDLGCGDGSLLQFLAGRLGISCAGIDIDLKNVISVIDKGFDILQEDIDEGLSMIPDATYDYAILRETLQVVKKPRYVLREMLRVAREGIVTFPNFGKLSRRLQLMFTGKMPKGGALPFEWYETPNIHLFTVRDFVELCRADGIRILEMSCLSSGAGGRLPGSIGALNLGADRVLVKISRG